MACALYYMDLHYEARAINTKNSDYEHLPMPDAYNLIQKHMWNIVPKFGQCTTYGHSFRSAGGHRKKYKNKEMSISELLTDEKPIPTVVVPQGKDDSVGHAVCVVDDLIFASTQKHALKLTKETLDWICGDGGYVGIYFALRFETKVGKGPLFKRKIIYHI